MPPVPLSLCRSLLCLICSPIPIICMVYFYSVSIIFWFFDRMGLANSYTSEKKRCHFSGWAKRQKTLQKHTLYPIQAFIILTPIHRIYCLFKHRVIHSYTLHTFCFCLHYIKYLLSPVLTFIVYICIMYMHKYYTKLNTED